MNELSVSYRIGKQLPAPNVFSSGIASAHPTQRRPVQAGKGLYCSPHDRGSDWGVFYERRIPTLFAVLKLTGVNCRNG